MKSSMQDKVEGTSHQVKGTLKAGVGKLTDNSKLEAEGNIEKFAGKVQRKSGQVKKVFDK